MLRQHLAVGLNQVAGDLGPREALDRAPAPGLAEAMAHGRPVVASAVGGLRDLVVDGETGLVVPPGDVAALRAALERLLADPELRRRLGAAARERARTRLSWETVTDATIAAYEDALRSPSTSSAAT